MLFYWRLVYILLVVTHPLCTHTHTRTRTHTSIQKMYFMYNSMFGSVGVMLRRAHLFASTNSEQQSQCDEDSVGWQRIRRVAALRKMARKLRQKCRQLDQDIEVSYHHYHHNCNSSSMYQLLSRVVFLPMGLCRDCCGGLWYDSTCS